MARRNYKKGDRYYNTLVVKSFPNHAFIIKTKNGWYYLLEPNPYDGYWGVKTDRSIDTCVKHHQKLLKLKL